MAKNSSKMFFCSTTVLSECVGEATLSWMAKNPRNRMSWAGRDAAANICCLYPEFVSWLSQIAAAQARLELHNLQLPASLGRFQVFLGLWSFLCFGLAKRRWWHLCGAVTKLCCSTCKPDFPAPKAAVAMQAPKKAIWGTALAQGKLFGSCACSECSLQLWTLSWLAGLWNLCCALWVTL